jgi:PPOX class probable F420-dependent enzyme
MTAIDTLGRQRTVLLETRKRDGTWVGTPVSIVVADGRAFFRTYDASGKAKRLRNFPEVRVAPSTLRGKPTGPSVTATARLLDDDQAVRVRALLAGKYPWLHGRLVPAVHRRNGWRTLHYELELR